MTKEDAIRMAADYLAVEPARIMVANQAETWTVIEQGSGRVGQTVKMFDRPHELFDNWVIQSVDHLQDGFPTLHIVPLE